MTKTLILTSYKENMIFQFTKVFKSNNLVSKSEYIRHSDGRETFEEFDAVKSPHEFSEENLKRGYEETVNIYKSADHFDIEEI